MRNTISNLILLVLVVFFTACETTLFPPSHQNNVYGAGWPAVHADARNSDYSPVAGPKNVTLAWQRKFAGTINLGPTSDTKGHVYITTTAPGCHLCALSATTGDT